MHWSIYRPIYLSSILIYRIYLSIYLSLSSICLFIYLYTIHLYIYTPIHLYTYTFIHLYIYTPIHLYYSSLPTMYLCIYEWPGPWPPATPVVSHITPPPPTSKPWHTLPSQPTLTKPPSQTTPPKPPPAPPSHTTATTTGEGGGYRGQVMYAILIYTHLHGHIYHIILYSCLYSYDVGTLNSIYNVYWKKQSTLQHPTWLRTSTRSHSRPWLLLVSPGENMPMIAIMANLPLASSADNFLVFSSASEEVNTLKP